MASNLQYSVTVRNAKLDAIETTIGTAPLLQIWTGTQPANCATASSGTKLVEMTLPSDWLANASSGSKAKSGTWSATAVASGTGGYYRITDSPGTTCHEQGTVGTSGADLNLDNTSINSGQTVTVSSYSKTAANA